LFLFFFFFFFFQAEDGIRDLIVTGVQTCALPISADVDAPSLQAHAVAAIQGLNGTDLKGRSINVSRAHPRSEGGSRGNPPRGWRSEERRVGKECRSRWSQEDEKKKERKRKKRR